MKKQQLRVLPGTYAITKGSGKPPLPESDVGLLAIVYDGEGYTWVGPQGSAPANSRTKSGFRVFEVEGPLEFELTGVLSGISAPLARAGVPIFVISTYDTDFILIPDEKLIPAMASLRKAGYIINAR